ncbi:MAG: tetratricopeptide repeat protein [Bacteroidaceae bacterium]|nr:tetratricopeptide repeat protein [Bacteroidaceae bacterium]
MKKQRFALFVWLLCAVQFSIFNFQFSTCKAQINTDRVMLMGRNALYYEDYVLSIQRFNMVISAKPFLAEPYFYRGLAKFYLEDYKGAEQDCTSAIERNPYTEDSYVLRGLCRVNLQDYVQAEQDYVKSTRINPQNKGSWHNMVLCQMEQKAYVRADSALDVMIRQWPREAENYTLKAQVRFAVEDTARAEEWITRALEVNPYEGPAWSMKAMVDLNRGHYADGEQDLDKAILQLPRNASLYVNRALARYHQQNLRGAMTDYDAALEIEPGNYLGHFNRGLLRAQVGDDNRAIEDFNFVLEQEPDNMIALYNRALLLDQTGDYRGAIRDISAVISEYPEFWTGYQTRAQIRRKIGDIYGAERDEFRVLKAEMEKRTGTYKSRTKTRKKSERNPEDYNKLVEEDAQQPERENYTSEYRGRVQDRQTDLTILPFYVMTYYKHTSAVSTFIPFHRTVDNFNRSGQLPLPLHISNGEANASEDRIQQHFQDIQAVTEVLGDSPETTGLYLRRAMDYYHVRDFESCILDLTRAIALQPRVALSYYLRAQVRCAQISSQTSLPGTSSSQPLSPTTEAKIGYGQALDDLQQVMQLEPDMLYAQYNIGNIYVQLHEYDHAEEAYTQALKIDPRFPDAYYNRGIVRLLDGNTQDGLSDLSQAGEYGLYGAYNLIKRYSKKH